MKLSTLCLNPLTRNRIRTPPLFLVFARVFKGCFRKSVWLNVVFS